MPTELNTADWSDSDDDGANDSDPTRKIKALEKKLALAQQSLGDYRALIAEKLSLTREVQNVDELGQSQPTAISRDDDTHYFESYGANGRSHKHYRTSLATSDFTQISMPS